MSTEEGSGMDNVEQSLDAAPEERRTLRQRLSDWKDSYIDLHTVDEEDKENDFEEAGFFEKPLAKDLSRRGFLLGAGQVAVGSYAAVEALDGDGFAVDWQSGNGDLNPVGGQAPDTPAGIGEVGDVSDELYLTEDGTVYAVDHGDKEWRAFKPEEFEMNTAYADLHADLSGSRETMEPAPGVSGIEVTKDELFQADSAAYDDMADEAEWDLIFDDNPTYSGGN